MGRLMSYIVRLTHEDLRELIGTVIHTDPAIGGIYSQRPGSSGRSGYLHRGLDEANLDRARTGLIACLADSIDESVAIYVTPGLRSDRLLPEESALIGLVSRACNICQVWSAKSERTPTRVDIRGYIIYATDSCTTIPLHTVIHDVAVHIAEELRNREAHVLAYWIRPGVEILNALKLAYLDFRIRRGI